MDVIESFNPIDMSEREQKLGVTGHTVDHDASLALQQASVTNRSIGLSSGAMQSGQVDSQQFDSSARTSLSEEQTIPVIREELKVGKREVQRGGIRAYHRMVEMPVSESVVFGKSILMLSGIL